MSGQKSNVTVQFKIEPNIIPATAIKKSQNNTHYAGEFGDVWKCYMSTKFKARPVAVKVIRVPDPSQIMLLRKTAEGEAYVWMQLLHDNILPLEGVTEGFGPLPALVTPWMENGTLDDCLRREVGLAWERKLSMVREVAAGLQYLHDEGIVHGGIDDTSVLVSSDGRLCLAAGFNNSKFVAKSSIPALKSFPTNKFRWRPPEVFVQEEDVMNNLKPTKAEDVYSYGCVMMRVFSGHQPYHHITCEEILLSTIRKEDDPFSQSDDIGKEIQQLAQLCWSRDREHRPLVAEIVELLWSQTNIAETMKTMLSQLLVTQISQAVLTKYDCHPDGIDVLGSALKCKWHGSSKTEVAVKTLRDDVNSQNDINKIFNRIRREMYVREKLKHEIILTLYGTTEGFGILPSFVYPWMAGGSLHDYVKREHPNLPARRKLDILLEVAHGIEYLHKWDVAHGNLTGDNVLLDGSGRVRIADFSHSVILDEADSRMFREQPPGDARYTAPEHTFTVGRLATPRPTKEGDVYSYGCVAILVLSGKVPYWWISEENQVLSEKEKGTWPFHPTVEVEVDEVHLNLVQQCLSTVKSRPSIEKVLYLFLVQRYGAADLTTWVERPDKFNQNFGGFANVHRCRLDLGGVNAVQQVVFRYQSPPMSTCVDVAVKEIILRNNTDMLTIINRLFREIKLWLKLEHENIVPFWGVVDGFGSLPALVSPWLENGALTGYLEREHERLSYNEKFTLLKDIARGLQYLHSQSITHGDLSGNNVLVDKDGKASLTDFGLSALVPKRTSQALVPTGHGGTVPYMPPEYLTDDDEGNASAPVFSPKSDVYSFGGIMLQVLEGKVPYHYIRNEFAIIIKISCGITPERPPISVVIDSDWDFMQACWSRDMERRPSDEDILKFVEGRIIIQS
ncbi:kinase-like domain-containing protein [Suillus variegatus]|nr:kinase-like domain-containing protein [Suillus variegatus]